MGHNAPGQVFHNWESMVKKEYLSLSMYSLYIHYKNFNSQVIQQTHTEMESYEKELARKC